MHPVAPDIHISYSKRKSLLFLAAVTILLVGLFFVMRGDFILENGKFLLILFYGVPILIIVSLVKVLKGKPLIMLNADSIWWKGEITDDRFYIPWQEIRNFEFNQGLFLNKSILVFVEHPERFVRGNWKTIEKQRKKIKETGTHLAIPINFIEQTEEEMLSLLNNYKDVVSGKRGAMLLPQL